MTNLKPITNFAGFLVRADGKIYDNRDGSMVLLNPWLDRGHMRLSLMPTVGRTRVKMNVSRIVAEAFVGPRPSLKHKVRHLDGNRSNNAAVNLQWATQREIVHTHPNCIAKHNRRQEQAKLFDNDIPVIRAMARDGIGLATIGRQFNVDASVISRIVDGTSWRHVKDAA